MKKLLLILAMFLLCCSCNLESDPIEQLTITEVKIVCPAYDVIFGVMTPFGPMVIHMDKGNFNEENHSLEQFQNLTGWITLEEYKAYIAMKESI